MSLSNENRKGQFELPLIAIIGGVIIGIVGLTILANIVGIRSVVKLTVQIDDQGTRLNSLLAARKGDLNMIGTLGMIKVPGFQENAELKSELDALRWNLVVLDQNNNQLRTYGEVRKDKRSFIQIPLAGVRNGGIEKGKMGVDTK